MQIHFYLPLEEIYKIIQNQHQNLNQQHLQLIQDLNGRRDWMPEEEKESNLINQN